MLAPFLLIAHAALEGRPCPSDDALAEVYGTRSPGRVRRLLAYIEGPGMIVTRIDFAGKRSIALPRLGMSTAAAALKNRRPAGRGRVGTYGLISVVAVSVQKKKQ